MCALEILLGQNGGGGGGGVGWEEVELSPLMDLASWQDCLATTCIVTCTCI